MPQFNKYILIGLTLVLTGFASGKYFGEIAPSLDGDSLAIALAIGSGIISWVVSKHYSQISAAHSLRDYGVQVARGVMVMQSNVRQLNEFVIEKRLATHTVQQELLVDAHLEHVQHTLIGLLKQADATLTGVAGIIGEDLKQHDDVVAQITAIRNQAASETKNLLLTQSSVNAPSVTQSNPGDVLELSRKLDEIDRRASDLIANVSKSTRLPVFEQATIERTVSVMCPYCKSENAVLMSGMPGQTKLTDCMSCRRLFNVHMSPTGIAFVRGIGRVRPDANNDWKAWRLPFSAIQFSALAEMVCRAARDLSDPVLRTPDALMNKCRATAVTDASGAELSDSVRSDFVLICWFGRMFVFSGMPGLAETYSNAEITRENVVMAVARYVGHKFGSASTPVEPLLTDELIRAFLGSNLSNGEIDLVRIAVRESSESVRKEANRKMA